MSKSKKSCSLTQWLKNFDRKFWEAVEESCTTVLFKTSKEAGVTFLYPVDATLRNKIISLLKDNDIEGIRMLQSLIITGYLPDGNAWDTQKDDIPNKLKIRMQVTSVIGDRVLLSNGAELTPMNAKNFTARQDRQNMAVWEYKGKNLMMEGDDTEFKYAKKGAAKPAPKKGGMFNKNLKIFGLAKSCEGKAVALLDAGKYNECNPYVTVLVSYLSYLKDKAPTDYQNCLMCVSYSPEATFYNMFQPYKPSSSVAYFHEWMNDTLAITLVESSAAKYLEYVQAAADLPTAEQNRMRTCELRKDLLENRVPGMLRPNILKEYQNNVDKAQQDETLFIILDRLPQILNLQGREAADSFRDLCFEIEILQRNGKIGCSLITGDLSPINDHHNNAGFYSSLVLFIMSDCFMYTPYLINDSKQIDQLAKNYLGDQLTPVSLSDVTLSQLDDGSVFVIMQQPANDYLQVLKKSQETVNIQSAFAEALSTLHVKDIGNNLKKALLNLCSDLNAPQSS